MSRFLAWTSERDKDRLLAALGFMASLSSPIVRCYGTETDISGGRPERGFTDAGRIAMPWNGLDRELIGRESTILRTRTQVPAITKVARLPLASEDRVLVMRKMHASGDVLVAVIVADEDQIVTLAASAIGSRDDGWTPLRGETAPVAGAGGEFTWRLPPLSTSWAVRPRQPPEP